MPSRKYLLYVSLICSQALFSQDKDSLKKQKQILEKEINLTTNLLDKTKKNKNKSLNYLKFISTQINNQKKLVKTLSTEIRINEKEIIKTEKEIFNVTRRISTEKKNYIKLKEEYAKMIYSMFLNKALRNSVIFIVSARDFNQAIKRIQYLKQYSSFRKNQTNKIKESKAKLINGQNILEEQRLKLLNEKIRKKQLINEKKKNLEKTNANKKIKEGLVNDLKRSEKQILQQLKSQRIKAQELEEKIKKIIAEEIRKAKEAIKDKKYNDLNTESVVLSNKFADNKGKLPWPLDNGVVVGKYGKQKHEVFSSVETFNNGIDIATNKNTAVRSIFDGRISRIFFIKGEGRAVLINHGSYFTVYSGLKEITVQVNEKIMANEKIGVVATQEKEEKTELHFEIWNGYEKQDPTKWLIDAY
tara:strand:- start:42 stop:1286 length:1245 start_codon:yes stop_codon:yes gene_type:complete